MSILLSPSRLLAFAQLLATFGIELVKSASRVAAAVLSPRVDVKPAIVAVPIDLKTDLGIATLANLVTLTPGTTSLHVSEGRDTLYVHVLDSPSAEAVAADIKSTFETLIRRIEG
ncbi:MAG: Na+/H+ antiporter subunit E [Salinarimonas sp.]